MLPRNKQPKNVSCYWQSDSSPIPQTKIEQIVTQTQANRWLAEQVADEHWTPKIGVITVEANVETTIDVLDEVTVEPVVVESPDVTIEEVTVVVETEKEEDDKW